MPRCAPAAAFLAALVLGAPLAAQEAPIDVAALAPRTLVYGMSAMGNPIMDATRTITREEVGGVDAVVVRNQAESGMIATRSEVAVAVADFAPIHFTMEATQGGMTTSAELRAADGRVTGRVEGPGNAIDVDEPLPEGAILQGMDELVIQATDWAATDSVAYPVFAPGRGVVTVGAHRTGTDTVTVPAGTFEVYRLEIRGGQLPVELLVRQEAPHILVRQTVPAQGMTVELKEIRK